MALWFVALSVALVVVVFDSAMLDYRLIMAGSVLPWLDFVWGPPWVMHSVLFPVAVMALVMVVGWGRRLVQRRWLGLAIGLLVHQVLSAGWTDATLFWWPAFGIDVDAARPPVPSSAVAIALEAVGLIMSVWLYRRLGLAEQRRRDRFVRTGHVDPTPLR